MEQQHENETEQGEVQFQGDSLETTWYVVFKNSERRRWWDIFTRDGFRHCFAFTNHKGMWVSVESLIWRTQVELVPHSVYKEYNVEGMLAYYMVTGDNTIVQVRSTPKPHERSKIIPFSCVSMVESLLGIEKHFWTPYGLYKHLSEMKNGDVIWRRSKTSEGRQFETDRRSQQTS